MKNFFKKIVLTIITFQAKFILKKNKPFIVAITGNLGKTTTKDMIVAAIKNDLRDKVSGENLVLGSKKSMNSEFGIPLTILGMESGWNSILSWITIILAGFSRMLDKYHFKYLVLEVGADSPNDIKKVCEYITPDVVVLTGFAKVPVHIEFFDGDRNKLIREKKYLVEALKSGGTFIFNEDDEDCKNIALEVLNKRKDEVNLKSFSLKEKESDIYTKEIKLISHETESGILKLDGLSADFILNKNIERKISLNQTLGEAIIYSVMPAILVGDILDIDIDHIIKNIESTNRTNGRMKILDGIYNTTIIDDTYNASPKAVEHGIETINKINTNNKKIFVLGDMLELGEFTKEEHEKIGELVSNKCDILITSGIRSKFIAKSAIMTGMNGENVYETTNSIEAGRTLLNILEALVEDDYKKGKVESNIGGHIIFIKGSQGSRMEKVVKMILSKNHNPQTDLVRQDEAWSFKK